MGAIVDIQMDRLRKLLTDRKIELVVSDAARNWLADKGYDPAYGARPLKRVIQKNVQDPMAEEILGGTIKDGDIVDVGVADGADQAQAAQGEGQSGLKARRAVSSRWRPVAAIAFASCGGRSVRLQP